MSPYPPFDQRTSADGLLATVSVERDHPAMASNDRSRVEYEKIMNEEKAA
jgi:hypothetical protein